MKNKFKFGIMAVASSITIACGNSGSENTASSSMGSFPALPSSGSEKVTLSGKMAFWMYEGDGGCFGTITDGVSEVELWIDADNCGDKEYEENQDATVEVTFRTENQYGQGKMYTITKFL